MSRYNVYFNGIKIDSAAIDGIEDVTFTYVKKQPNGDAANNFSQELTLRGEAYKFIKNSILDQSSPILASIDVLIKDSEMTNADGSEYEWFNGKMQGADIEELPLKCEATAPVIDNSQKAQKLTCLKNTLIWSKSEKADGTGLSDGEDTYRQARYIPYCVDNDASEILMILGMIAQIVLVPVSLVLALIVEVINTIIKAINLIPTVNVKEIDFDGNDDTNAFQEALILSKMLTNKVTGCGYKHKAPYVHSYIQNACDICGLTFSSSLFEPNKPLHDLVRLDAVREKGGADTNSIEQSFEQNKPNKNAEQFLTELCGEWMRWELIEGGDVLSIEPLDAIQPRTWFNIADLPSELLSKNGLKYRMLKEAPPAFGIFEYIKDGIDTAGDTVNNKWTDRVIDFNVPPLDSQKGHISKTIPFGTSRFRNDNQANNKAAVDMPFFTAFYFEIAKHQNALLLGRHTFSFPKLILIDPLSLQSAAKPYRMNYNGLYDYCVPLWLRESYIDPNGNNVATLYDLLFYIFNPRTQGLKNQSYSLELIYTCELLQSIDLNANIVLTDGKIGDIEKVEVSPSNGTITITGKC